MAGRGSAVLRLGLRSLWRRERPLSTLTSGLGGERGFHSVSRPDASGAQPSGGDTAAAEIFKAGADPNCGLSQANPPRSGPASAAASLKASLNCANLQFLLDQGLRAGEAKELLARLPQNFRQPLDSVPMKAKLRLCEELLGITPRAALLHHRGFLLEGLAKVDRRVSFMERAGALHRLESGSTVWVVTDSTHTFCSRLGANKEEFRAFVADWRRSQGGHA